MAANKTDIWVYAHWKGLAEPQLIGTLSAHQAKGRKAFSFEYEKSWINSQAQILLDPDISWYTGTQFPLGKENFGVFMDSMPDTWGRKLMQRRATIKAREEGKATPNLYELDYLLGVHDSTRMGALRFKLNPDGPFLDNDPHSPTPPWAHIRELQQSAEAFEENENSADDKKWLDLLIAPGSSLGGARPKANILDQNGHPWIAKFPSNNDTTDKAAWEYLAHLLAIEAGINMAECKLEKVHGPYRTFFTTRFDRERGERIHFASAMTMTGKNEEIIRGETPSYLDIAEFLQYSGVDMNADLRQLWRRIVFNITISNTDDHLRNHGFILSDKGWRLSPAYDLNPSIDKSGLGLNIDMDNNMLDYDLAKSVGPFFRLGEEEMDKIIDEVRIAVRKWQQVAAKIGISRAEQELMASAFALSTR
ncbi:MAG: type II toxin-antitoxin system HipA family toxin [Pedobacter sp.]|nr:type II toxin-antitoxin system HipA family toxin [Pedobacter sp.]